MSMLFLLYSPLRTDIGLRKNLSVIVRSLLTYRSSRSWEGHQTTPTNLTVRSLHQVRTPRTAISRHGSVGRAGRRGDVSRFSHNHTLHSEGICAWAWHTGHPRQFRYHCSGWRYTLNLLAPDHCIETGIHCNCEQLHLFISQLYWISSFLCST